MAEEILVVVTGPVGGGKSTVALSLANRFRELGRTAAVIDLDLVYCMARQVEGFGEETIWITARRGSAALADTFFADGLKVVIVEGEFFNQEELDTLQKSLRTAAKYHFVTLEVTYEKTLERVSQDLSRGMSRDPQFLQRLHSQFVASLPFLRGSTSVVDANRQSPRELAYQIADAVLSRSK